jgi:hypothetical protein
MKPFIFTSAALLVAALASGQENYETGWSHHRDVILNTTPGGANVSTTVTEFPLLVRLDSSSAHVFAQARGDGADIRSTKADDVTRLPHEIGHWDSAGGSAAIWVKVDTILGNSTENLIRMHWGNATAADSSNGTAVFSNGFTNVWHLGNATGTDPRPNAISGGNPATPTNFPGSYTAHPGIISFSDHMRGGGGGTGTINNDHLSLGEITTDYSQGFTFSVWIYPEIEGSGTTYYTASEDASGTGTGGIIVVGIQGNPPGAKFRMRNGTSGGNSGIINSDFGDLTGPTNTWRHLMYTKAAGNGDMDVYMNGVLAAGDFGAGTEAFSSVTRTVNQLGITLAHMNYNDDAFQGRMEEGRLANVGRSAAWVRLEFQNQRAAQTLVVFDSIPASVDRGRLASRRGDLSVHAVGGSVVFRVGENPHGARLTVLDLRGRAVWNGVVAPGIDRIEWAGAAGRTGMHVARLSRLDAHGKITGVTEEKVPLTR